MKKFVIALVLFGFFSQAFAQQMPVLEMYHGAECPHCQRQMKWLPTLEKMYPGIQIRKFEVWHDAENQKKLEKRLSELGKSPSGVPTNIIEDEVIVGFQPDRIVATLAKYFGEPVQTEIEEDEKTDDSSGVPNWVWVAVLIVLAGGAVIFYRKN